VQLPVGAEPDEARVREARRGRRAVRELVARDDLGAEASRGSGARPDRGRRERAGRQGCLEPDDLEEAAAPVARERADAHPGEDLVQAVLDRPHDVRLGGLGRELLIAASARDFACQLQREPRVDRSGAGGEQHRDAVDVERVRGLDDEVDLVAEAEPPERRMRDARSEQARDRETIRPGRSVGDGDEERAAAGGREHLALDLFKAASQPCSAAPARPRGIDPDDAGAVTAGIEPREQAQPRRLTEDGAADCDEVARRGRGGRVEQRRPGADDGLERDHDALALGVDRWVRDLREGLPEVRAHGAGATREDGHGRVVAHAPDGFLARRRHGLDDDPQLLGVEAEQQALALVGRGRRCAAFGNRTRLQRRSVGFAPIRDQADDLGLGRRILEEPARDGVDQNQPARIQPCAQDDIRDGQLDRAGLGRADDQAVGVELIRHGPQPVAIEDRPHALAVGEHERRGTIPRLDACGIRVLPRLEAIDWLRPQAGRLGDERGQRRRDRPARCDEQLECLVERCGIGAARIEHRQPGADLGAQPAPERAAQTRRTPLHRGAIAAHSVDLAVVGDEPERLREPPRRMRVRRVALVEDGQGDGEARVGEIAVERAELAADEQALVDDGPARERRRVQVLEPFGRPGRAFDGAASKEQPRLEGQPAGRPTGAAATCRDDDLLDRRSALEGCRTQDRGVDRHGAPAERLEALGPEGVVNDAPRGGSRLVLGGQEEHADRELAVTGGRTQPGFIDDPVAQSGDRERDPGAVAGLRVGGDRTAVRQTRKRLEGEGQDAL
jgi:hypothetical protein